MISIQFQVFDTPAKEPYELRWHLSTMTREQAVKAIKLLTVVNSKIRTTAEERFEDFNVDP